MESKKLANSKGNGGMFLGKIWNNFKEHPIKFGCFTYILLMIVASVIWGISSSISDASKKSQKESCQQETYEELKKTDKNAPKSYEEAFQKNDFAAARLYLACYDRSDLLGSFDYDDKKRDLDKAEMTSLLRLKKIDKARALATESNLIATFQENVSEMILPQFLSENDLESSISVLNDWTFSEMPVFEAQEVKDKDIKRQNSSYNEEINKYNALVDKVLQKAISLKDKAKAKACLILYKEILVMDKKVEVNKIETEASKDNHFWEDKEYTYFYDVTFKKENPARTSAEKKIKETIK